MNKKDNDDIENEYEDALDEDEASDDDESSYDEDADQEDLYQNDTDEDSDEALDTQGYSDELDAEINADENEDTDEAEEEIEIEEDEVDAIQGGEGQKSFLQKYFNVLVGGGFALFLVVVFFIQFGNPFSSSEPTYASVPPLSLDVIKGNTQQTTPQAEGRSSGREADLASLSKAERATKPFLTAPGATVPDSVRAGTNVARQTFSAPIMEEGPSATPGSEVSGQDERFARLEERLEQVLEDRKKVQAELAELKVTLSEVSSHLLTLDSALKERGSSEATGRNVSFDVEPLLEQLSSRIDALDQRFDTVAKNVGQMSQSELQTADAKELQELKQQVRRHEELLAATRNEARQLPESAVASDVGSAAKPESPKQFRWVLRTATAGQAWVSLEGQGGQRRVIPGDVLNGIGRIQAIKKVGERWVVEGTEGLIQ